MTTTCVHLSLHYDDELELTPSRAPAQIVGMNWLEIKAGGWQHKRDKISSCQYEIECECVPLPPLSLAPRRRPELTLEPPCSHTALISHEAVGDWSGVAPLRILSFDIECAGRKGIFPEADKDPVIQIANMVTRQGALSLPAPSSDPSFPPLEERES